MGRPVSARRILEAAALSLMLMLLAPLAARAAESADCPNRRLPGFRTYLPDCRAYELVTPGYKEGFSAVFSGSIMGMSEHGDQILFETLGNFAGLESPGLLGANYRIERTAEGWTPSPLQLPLSQFFAFGLLSVSWDFTGGFWFSHGPGGSEQEALFSSGSSLMPIGASAPPGGLQLALNFAGASKDLRHAVFIARSPGPREDHRIWPGDPTSGGRNPSLYEYVGTGNAEPSLVGVKNEGNLREEARVEGKGYLNEAAELIGDCGTVLGSEEDTYNAISETGTTVFFTTYACGGSPVVNEVYARIGEEKTVAISQPTYPPGQSSGTGPEECDAACRGAEQRSATFVGASADGSKVFFLTAQPLLNSDGNAGTDLYEAEIEGAGGEAKGAKLSRLTLISTEDPDFAEAAEVQGVARVSQDGSHVYFVAKGKLTSEPRGGPGGACIAQLSPTELAEENSAKEGPCRPKKDKDNLYVYERDTRYPNGHTAFVATLGPTDGEDWQTTDLRPVQATPDGRFLAFQSTADLTPDQEGREEKGQIFEYGAEAETLVRVSQGQGGYNEDGNSQLYSATIPHQVYINSSPTSRFLRLAISADGSRVFFTSEDALTPQASSGSNNVYEYQAGHVALISDGHDAVVVAHQPATELIGTDESGTDVFFTTADPLVPQDTDTQADLYDARSEGGFPAPATAAPCSGDSCQTPPSVAPSVLAPGVASVGTEAPTSSSPPIAGPTKKAAKPKRKHKTNKRRTKKSRAKRSRKATGKRGRR